MKVFKLKFLILLFVGLSLELDLSYARENIVIDSYQTKFSESTKAQWSNHFAGSPQFPLKSNFSKFLVHDPSCQKKVDAIMDATFKYGEMLLMDRSKAAIKKSKNILNALQKLERENNPCFDSVANGYIVAALFLLDSNSSLPSYKNAPYVDYRLALVGTAAVNHGFIHAIKKSERKAWGDAWTSQKSGQRYPDVLGAYDCSNSLIFIDPYLSPMDLGASFAHELDHLFRDKLLTDSRYLENQRSYTLFDETLAVVLMAGLQYNLEVNPRGDLEVGFLKELFDNSYDSYATSFDLTMYIHEGQWSQFVRKNHYIFNSYNFPWNGVGLILRDDPRYDLNRWSNWGAQNDNSYLEYIYSKVSNAYFGKNFDQGQKEWLSPKNQSPNAIALSSVIQQIASTSGYFVGDEEPTEWTFLYRDTTYSRRNERPFRGTVAMRKVLNIFDELFSKKVTKSLSPLCVAFENAISNGELDDYAGKGMNERPGQEGVKPGQEGVKPGQEGVKPGQEGVKPGQEGVKPGQEGVKPGQEGVKPSKTIRPCLNVYQGI